MFWKKPPETPKSEPAKPSRDALIRQAKAHIASAREELGQENIDKMRAVLLAQQKQQQAAAASKAAGTEHSPAERARELMKTMDKAKLADYIRTLSREDKD